MSETKELTRKMKRLTKKIAKWRAEGEKMRAEMVILLNRAGSPVTKAVQPDDFAEDELTFVASQMPTGNIVMYGAIGKDGVLLNELAEIPGVFLMQANLYELRHQIVSNSIDRKRMAGKFGDKFVQ